ncbi:DUF3017 domain-containing protein, partial [Georgenia sp. 10Sc9-8]|nr:DUF3017 domain-containing protein [Georgenia halotolerans]
GTPSLRSTLMAVTLGAVVAVCLVAVLVDGRAAMYVLAGTLAALGLVRLAVPSGAGIAVRARPVDVVVLLGLATAIALLAPWGNAALPASA